VKKIIILVSGALTSSIRRVRPVETTTLGQQVPELVAAFGSVWVGRATLVGAG
jgi:hypothetical protein